jgi:hypothetical protein
LNIGNWITGSAGAITIPGSLTTEGFTSTGIDDNATSTAITIDASEKVFFGDVGNSADPSIYKHPSNSHDYIVSGTNRTLKLGGASGHCNVAFGGSSASSTVFETGGSEAMRIHDDGNVAIGATNNPSSRLFLYNSTGRMTQLQGNGNNQGGSYNITLVKHVPQVSLNTKLLIPFLVQGNLNCTHLVKVKGHNAAYNSSNPKPFEASFACGGTSSQGHLTSWGLQGITAVVANGATIELTLPATFSNGVYVTIEYMTNRVGYSIVQDNVALN